MLTALQEKVMIDMVGGMWKDAAEKADIPLRTIAEWMLDPAFRVQYRRIQRQAFDDADAVLQRASIRAEDLLESLMYLDGIDSDLVEGALNILERIERARSTMAALVEAQERFFVAV